MKLRFLAFVPLLAVSLVCAQAAPTAKFHFIACPNSPETHLNGVNNSNLHVGFCLGADGVYHGLLEANGNLTFLDNPHTSIATILEDVNFTGTIVGFYLDDAGTHHAFSYAVGNGQFTDLEPPGSIFSLAFGVDDLGRVVGQAEDMQGIFRGWYFDGSYHSVELGVGETAIWDLNSNSQALIVWQDETGNSRSSLYQSGKLTDIDVPGAVSTTARGINNAGDVVLSWTDEAFIDHGALLTEGKFTKFDAPGCDMTDPGRVNDNHVIVGTCTTSEVIKGFYVTY